MQKINEINFNDRIAVIRLIRGHYFIHEKFNEHRWGTNTNRIDQLNDCIERIFKLNDEEV
jgi:hypothetical protein